MCDVQAVRIVELEALLKTVLDENEKFKQNEVEENTDEEDWDCDYCGSLNGG
jgi:hypothetical protein